MTGESLKIRAKAHDYEVVFFEKLDEALARPSGSGGQEFWLVDAQLPELFPEVFRGWETRPKVVFVEAHERNKSYEALTPLLMRFIELGIRRDACLVVVGGGIVQDIGCFIASVVARGIRWEFVPTTLLAQVDSCIGSKSSLNIGDYKNQLGTFYPPHRIHLANRATETLALRDVHSGIGELVKFFLLTDEGAFREFVAEISGNELSSDWRESWTRRALEIKKVFIEEDEFDRGRRNLLNYGHTFGHAFESATHYELPHGVAVLFGMLAATFVSARLGFVEQRDYEELRRALAPWVEPYARILEGADFEAVLNAMKRDKKNTAQGVNFILTRGIGRMERVAVDLVTVRPFLTEFFRQLV